MKDFIDAVEDYASDIVLQKIISKISGIVFQKLTWLAWPPLSWVFGFILNKVVAVLYKEGMLNLKYFGIDVDVDRQNEAAKAAKEELGKVMAGGNKDETAKAKEDFRKKYSDLVTLKPQP